MRKETINLDGKQFRFVKRSRRGEVTVYTDGELFARVGKSDAIDRIVALHKKFVEFGFQVPEIVGQGEIAGQGYFLEKSLGEKCFSFLFQDDIEKYGAITPELFEKFIFITEKFARAQLSSTVTDSKGLSITELVRPEDLAEELPKQGGKILKLYDEALEVVKIFPLVLTHGDSNPHNMFPLGVIDFEKPYYCPAGYDAVTNVFHINFFPTDQNYEYFRYYSFTAEQEAFYYERLDTLYLGVGLPKLSDYKNYFEYFRAIWATKQNFQAPKLQQWRYELFKKQYLL